MRASRSHFETNETPQVRVDPKTKTVEEESGFVEQFGVNLLRSEFQRSGQNSLHDLSTTELIDESPHLLQGWITSLIICHGVSFPSFIARTVRLLTRRHWTVATFHQSLLTKRAFNKQAVVKIRKKLH
jgi:hypothetical protein